MDSSSTLKEIKYVRDTSITLEPNTMYNPDSAQNSGWDRLIIMEAFPLSEKSKSKTRFIIPVFIHNKFSCEDASTFLSVSDVIAAHGHCINFMNRYALASQFHFSLLEENGSLLSRDPPKLTSFFYCCQTQFKSEYYYELAAECHVLFKS